MSDWRIFTIKALSFRDGASLAKESFNNQMDHPVLIFHEADVGHDLQVFLLLFSIHIPRGTLGI